MRGDLALFIVVFTAIIVPLAFINPEDRFFADEPELQEPSSATNKQDGALAMGILLCIIAASGLALWIFRRQIEQMSLSTKKRIPPVAEFFEASRKLKRSRQEVHKDLIRQGMAKQQADKLLYFYRPE